MFQYFIFNGKNSLDMGVVVLTVPPITMAERSVNAVEIAGRNGSYHEDLQTFKNYTKTMECQVRHKKQIPLVAEWLTGSGEMIFSTEPEYVYRVMIQTSMEITGTALNINEFFVEMDTQPFKYSRNTYSDTLDLTQPTTIYNRGTIYSTPILTIYGTGDLDFTVNGTSFTLTDVSESITINCEMEEVYKDGVGCNLQYIGSAFPRLDVGGNAITWTGDVEKVVVEPNWRWR